MIRCLAQDIDIVMVSRETKATKLFQNCGHLDYKTHNHTDISSRNFSIDRSFIIYEISATPRVTRKVRFIPKGSKRFKIPYLEAIKKGNSEICLLETE